MGGWRGRDARIERDDASFGGDEHHHGGLGDHPTDRRTVGGGRARETRQQVELEQVRIVGQQATLDQDRLDLTHVRVLAGHQLEVLQRVVERPVRQLVDYPRRVAQHLPRTCGTTSATNARRSVQDFIR